MMTDKPLQQTLLKGKPWVPSELTNVQETWRKFGWTPTFPASAPGNDPMYQQKWVSNGRLHQDCAP